MSFDLSFAQKEIYEVERFFPDTSVNNVCITISLKKHFTYEAVNNALNCAVKHFSSLRIFCMMCKKDIKQRIVEFKANDHPLLCFDKTEEYNEWATVESSIPVFQLESPLFRFVIIHIREKNSAKIFAKFHHLVADALGSANFFRYICSCLENEDINYEEQKYSYADVVAKEQEYLTSQEFKYDMSYWDTKLKEYSGKKMFFHDSFKESLGACFETFLSVGDSNLIKHFCQHNSISIPCFMNAMAALYKSKLTACNHTSIGMLLHNRRYQWEKHMLGTFSRVLPLMMSIDSDMSALEYFKYVWLCQLKVIKHSKYPYEYILSSGEEAYGLIDFMVSYQTVSEENHYRIGYGAEWIHSNNHGNAFCMHISDRFNSQQIKFEYDYQRNQISETSVHLMHKRLLGMINQVICTPSMKVSDIEMITSGEKQRVLNCYNATTTIYQENKTITEVFEKLVAKSPFDVALVFEGAQLTYAELNAKSNQLARKLRGYGIKPDDFVAISSERSLEMIVGIYGILKSGGAYVPMDPKYPEDRIRYMLEDCKPKAVLIYGTKIEADVPVIDLADGSIWVGETENLKNVNKPTDLAYCIYTSGTTGKPKGVMIEHRSLANVIFAYHDIYGITKDDVLLQFATITFDQSVWDIFSILSIGGTLCIASLDSFDGTTHLEDYLNVNKVTVAALTPEFIKELRPQNLKYLRVLESGGDKAQPSILKKWLAEGYKIFNTYGPTECTINVASYQLQSGELSNIPIGKPISNIQIYILNGNELCGIDMPGELCVAGVGLARGYLNQPELTSEKFVENPYGEGKLYRSGDLARWLPNGNIECLGRIDDQVKIRGFRIELGEIESRLLEFAGVNDAIALAIEDEGGDNKCLCAYVVSERELSVKELREHLLRSLPEHMIPSYFVQIDLIPLNTSGKVDRKALPSPKGGIGSDTEYEAPQTDEEKVLAKVYTEILGIESVGVRDDFFHLGGDSIKAIRIVSKLREEGYELSIQDLMRHSVIESVGKKLKKRKKDEMMHEQGEVVGEIPFTPIQTMYLESALPNPNHFNQAITQVATERIDTEVLIAVLDSMVKHHDILRVVYRDSKQELLGSDVSIGYELYEYDYKETAFTDLELTEEIEAKSNEIQASIDLATGPMMKVGLFRTAEADHLMIWIHRLVVDGISLRIFTEDFEVGYIQYLSKGAIKFSEKTASYKAWSEALQEYSNSEELMREVAYWEHVAGSVSEGNIFKTITGYEGVEHISIMLNKEYTEKLLYKSAKAFGTEINDLLLSGLGLAVKELTNKEKVSVNLESHGREAVYKHVDIDRTIGCFTVMYPIVILANNDIKGLIIKTKEMLRKVPNKGLGYGVLKYISGTEFSNVEAQITFSYLGNIDVDIGSRGAMFLTSKYNAGRAITPENTQKEALNINCMISGGKLRINISYRKDKVLDEDAKHFAQLYIAALRNVINVCVEQAEPIKTSSDFELSDDRISQSALDTILENFG